MLFRAQNLGPIRDAELDLSKRLIILAGPNNSGKTYLGWALYGLSQSSRPLPCVRKLVDAALASPTGSYDAGPVQEFIAIFAAELCAAYAKHIHRDFSAAAKSFASTLLTLTPDATPILQQLSNVRAGEYRIQFRISGQHGSLRVEVYARRPTRTSEEVSGATVHHTDVLTEISHYPRYLPTTSSVSPTTRADLSPTALAGRYFVALSRFSPSNESPPLSSRASC